MTEDLSSDEVSRPEFTKSCSTCALTIPEKARKCTKCDSFQDWRKYIAFSTTNLALMTALLSVATLAGPNIFNLFGTNNSDLRVSFQGIQDNAAIVLIANTGNRPGSAGNATIALDSWGEKGIALVVPLNADKNYGIVEAGAVKAVVFESPPPASDDEKRYEEQWGLVQNCTLRYELRDFLQKSTSKKEKIDCWAARDLLLHRKSKHREV